MAKDPRFNFYPDNWDGGTEEFTLEQEGAYLRLIIMQSRKGKFTADQALDCLMRKTRGNAAACAVLWNFLRTKFETDGTLFWSARLEKEIAKSRAYSEKQSERAKKRFFDKSGDATASAAAVPVNRTGTGIENGSEKERGVRGENQPTPADDMLEDYIEWTEEVIAKNDQVFEQMLMKERVNPNGQLQTLARDHLGLLSRYPKMRPANQMRFRYSLLNHIRENFKPHTDEPIKRTPATALTDAPAGGFGKL